MKSVLLVALAPLVFVSRPTASRAPQGETPAPTGVRGFLRDPADWAQIPAAGVAWDNVLAWAEKWNDGLDPDLTEHAATGPEDQHDVVTLACALAWRGTGNVLWRFRTRLMLAEAIAANSPVAGLTGSALRPGRNLLSYVLAASTIDLPGWAVQADLDGAFRAWIHEVSEVHLWIGAGVGGPGGTFATYNERRPNNIGLVIGAARIAVDMYLGGLEHRAHLTEAKQIFRGFLGDDTAYRFADSEFGGATSERDTSWHADAAHFQGINPPGARITRPVLQTNEMPLLIDVDVDGSLPEEMRRLNESGCHTCGPSDEGMSVRCYNPADTIDGGARPGMDGTNYVWEALQGLVMQAYLLHRCGFGAFTWESDAVERTHRFLYVTYGLRAQDTWDDPSQVDNPDCCDGAGHRSNVDDTWVPHIVAAIYHPAYLDATSLVYGGKPGKNCGFADWWTIGL